MSSPVPKLVDCFLFHNEVELLELRLQLLHGLVDKFVVVWANETFTGKKKTETFPVDVIDSSHARDKIEVVRIDKLIGQSAWDKEAYSRNALARGLTALEPHDLVMISDVDEIPRPDVLRELSASSAKGVRTLAQDYFNFKFNYQLVHGLHAVWAGPAICDFASFSSPQALRDMRWKQLLAGDAVVHDAGWHFSYLTQTASVEDKLASFSHQEREIQNRTQDVRELIRSRRGFHDHIHPGSVWAVVDLADLRCPELEQLVRGYPALLQDEPPDDTAAVSLQCRLSTYRMQALEREKMLRWYSAAEILAELWRRVRGRVRRIAGSRP